MENRVWYSVKEALPPLDDNDCNCSVIVALVLKSGVLTKGFRQSNCWVILDGKDTKLSDDEIISWSQVPILAEKQGWKIFQE